MNPSHAFGDFVSEAFYNSKLHSVRDKHSKASIEISSMLNSSKSLGKNQIEELLRCVICFGKVRNPQMCPVCSKLCCNPCIKKWLTEQKSQCPHCRCPLRVSQLVNCRFVSEIASVIEQMHTKKEEEIDLCGIHQTQLSYYCKTCEIPVCADCAMFGSEHKNHEFDRIAEVYETHVELVKYEAQGLKTRLKELNGQLAAIVSAIEQVTRGKEERAAELDIILEQLNKKLEAELKSKLRGLLAQKGTITDEIDNLESLQNDLKIQLEKLPKSSMIAKSIEFVKMFQEVNAKPLLKFNKNSITPEFKSEIVPQYESSIFYLKPFSILRHTAEIVYSEPLIANGLVWRLKVYPNGNGQAKNEYLSVFLEMVKGFGGLAKYEYKVEMVNRKNPEIATIREFASEFETGECWGYNKFFKIDQLEREGYLTPEEDIVMLKFFVRAPTYYQQCQDQKRYIQHLEKLKSQSKVMISELKEKLIHEMEKKIKPMETNPSLMLTIKNSINSDYLDDGGNEALMDEMSLKQEKFSNKSSPQTDGESNGINKKFESEIGFPLKKEEDSEEEKEAHDHSSEPRIQSDVESKYIEDDKDSDLPAFEQPGDRSLEEIDGNIKMQEYKSPLLQEFKVQNTSDNAGDDLDLQYGKLDAFLNTYNKNLSDPEPDEFVKKSSSDEKALESSNGSLNGETTSLDEFCDKIHANIKAEENLQPIVVDNLFNIKSQESLSKPVNKNLLSAFNAETSTINKENKDRLDKNFLQLSDSLLKKLNGLKHKEKNIDKSTDENKYVL